MALKYKIDVIAALKEAGYNTNRIRKEKIMGEAMLQKIRGGQMVSWATLEKICNLLDCQPGDLLEYVKEVAPRRCAACQIGGLPHVSRYRLIPCPYHGRNFRVGEKEDSDAEKEDTAS